MAPTPGGRGQGAQQRDRSQGAWISFFHRSRTRNDGILAGDPCSSLDLAKNPRRSVEPGCGCFGNGTIVVQLLNMVLDFLDALSGAVAIAYWWCTWVRPSKQPPHPPEASPVSGRAEVDRFVQEARGGLNPKQLCP
jgi:hypothetical protein